MEKVKAQLGQRGIRGLGKAFNTMDTNGNRKLDSSELFVGLSHCGCNLTEGESDLLLASLDTNKDGSVNFDEFLVGLRGQLSLARAAVVANAFTKFDTNQNGFINAEDLKGVYCVSSHPKVISGEMTEDEAFLEFLANFADRNNDGTITREEWCDFYAAVSASVDTDDFFVALLRKAWKM
jgi:Ca2+-binding EF-hand superfamily protein